MMVWYSRSGTTERAVERAEAELCRRGHEAAGVRLRPLWDLDYFLWLALSFYPGSRVPLDGPPPDLSRFDACLLAMPKWTLSCPPINEFLARCGRRLPPTGVLVTCGGWDQDRYLRDFEVDLRRLGVIALGGLSLKRRTVESGEFGPELESFIGRAFP